MEENWISEAEVAAIVGLKNVKTLKTWRWAKKHPLLVHKKSEQNRKILYSATSVSEFAVKYKERMERREQNKIKAALRKRRVAREEIQDSGV